MTPRLNQGLHTNACAQLFAHGHELTIEKRRLILMIDRESVLASLSSTESLDPLDSPGTGVFVLADDVSAL